MAILRTPSPKKSFKAKTTGKIKRSAKKSIPGYGQKGMGWANDPKRAAYNHVYKKTTVGMTDAGKSSSSDKENYEFWSTFLSILFVVYVFAGFKIGFDKATAIAKYILIVIVAIAAIYYGVKIYRFFKD
ncbi:hypothetical protein [Enterococcus cecorum]|uniref:hypothetical protein n=1 Tax=Enterococcus cecorum TaxID=44008 RepID=UPI002ACA6338|nr:hypothetical protein [Enterococcus cecorum]MDZ5560944.1 hypothetical protein [Enterococcus cecorum]